MAGIRKPLNQFIAPKYWLTWLGLGLLRVACWLPHSVVLGIGRMIGKLAHRIAGDRRAIVRRNLELCFPDMPSADRDKLARRHFEALGMSLMEMGLGRWASDDHLTALTTIEGVALKDRLHPLQQKFLEHAALQCGICTPGFIVSAKALLDQNPDPTEHEVRLWLAGNLCRCTGYDKIVRAVLDAADSPEMESVRG